VADDDVKDLDELDDKDYEGEAEEQEVDEQEGSETDGSEQEPEEYEVVLEGDEQAAPKEGKKKTVTVPAATLAKLRESRREERARNEELERQLAEARNGTQSQQPQQRAMPTLASCDYDEQKHAEQMAAWFAEQQQHQLQAYQTRQQREQQAAAQKQQVEAKLSEHYQRASDLRVADYQQAEESVRNTLGHEIADLMIARLGEGSEKVTYHLGKNPEKLQSLMESLQRDPSGLEAMVTLGELRSRLKVQPARKASSAPPADEALTGASSGQNDGAILKRLEKAHKLSDRTQFRKMKAELVASGRSDLLKRHGYI